MILLELISDGCIRLMRNNIKKFHYKPKSLYQLILGNNGSGKSTVASEASPMPGEPKAYIKGGQKISRWLHNGSEYLLTSTFDRGGRHSFIRDGEELNPGGTISVQKELVRQDFGWTTELHELLTGEMRFTQMSLTDRRKWLTMLCDTDFSFALGVFKRLSTAGRDMQGTYRQLSDRLVNETKKLKALGETSEWGDEARQLQKELEILFLNRSNRNLTGTETRINNMLDWECQQADRMLAMGNPIKGKFSSMEELEDRVVGIDKEVDLVKHSREWTTEALEDLQQLQKTVEGGEVGTLEEAEATLETLTTKTTELRGMMTHYKDFGETSAIAVMNSVESVKEELNDVLSNIPDNSDKQFNKQTVQEARDARVRLRQSAEGFTNRVAKEEATLEHIQGLCKSECPQCRHTWLPGNTENRKVHAEKALVEFQKRLAETQDDLKACEKFLEDAQEFSGYFMRFRALVSNNPCLGIFWDSMLEVDAINNSPKSWMRNYNWFSKDARIWLEVEELERRIDKLNLTVDALKKTSGIEQLALRIAQHTQKISTLTEQLVELEYQRTELHQMRHKASQLIEMDRQLRLSHDNRAVAFEDLVVEMRDDSIAEVVRAHQSRLAFLQGKLAEKKTIEDLLGDLELFRAETGLKQQAYKLLADELSPKDGAIAEQLSGFINSFAEHMNSIISNVWTTEMKVLPCGIDSGEMDYRFPLLVEADPIPSADIAKSSRGQAEMIDFAFVLLVIFYLRLECPLYLDELGATFDETHRANVMNFVKDLVDSRGFSQVFMISHYASSHGAFTQAEVLVMDSTNITVPTKYNQHVIMG